MMQPGDIYEDDDGNKIIFYRIKVDHEAGTWSAFYDNLHGRPAGAFLNCQSAEELLDRCHKSCGKYVGHMRFQGAWKKYKRALAKIDRLEAQKEINLPEWINDAGMIAWIHEHTDLDLTPEQLDIILHTQWRKLIEDICDSGHINIDALTPLRDQFLSYEAPEHSPVIEGAKAWWKFFKSTWRRVRNKS